MKRSFRLAAAVAGAALVVVAAPIHATAQPLYQSTRCLAAYQDQMFTANMQPVVEYTPPETFTIYPGHAVSPVLNIVGATLDYVNCVLP